MKNEYLLQLKTLLDRYEMDQDEKQDILNDYSDMYDNWIDRGMSIEEVEEKLGKPKSIIRSLVEGYKKIPKPSDNRTKLIAVSPFISLIAFFVLGFGFNEWVYSWMVFLFIPVIAIIVEMTRDKDPHVTTALSPFAASIAYYILGMQYGLWHPGWIVFIIIPILGVFNSRKDMDFKTLITALSPFAALIAYLYIGEMGYYHPGWLIFLIVPFIGATHEKPFGKALFIMTSIVFGAALYLYIGYEFDEWYLGGFAFLPLIVFYIYNGNIVIFASDEDVPKGYKIAVLVSGIAYLIVSLLTQAWLITWLIFLIIPVYAINREVSGNERTIALTPFLSLTIFMLLGYFLGAWAWAWLAFLIIPITAIIKEA